MGTPRHILVGTDFSEASQSALETARDLARAVDAKLTLLHVYPAGLDALGPQVGVGQRMAIGHDVHEALAKLKDRAHGVTKLHAEIVENDSPAGAICDYAGANQVDLIVVGSHGYGAAKRFLLGSVAERVVRHAPCAVLIAR